jgi:L-ascorbate metabolism protein UlaG (beta-lactamase superfamily)
MKRRKFIRYVQAGLLTTATTGLVSGGTSGWQITQAQSNESLSVEWLGHTCFLFIGSGRRILVNPFRPIGCTAGYRSPDVVADLVLVSSLLLDEGNLDGLSDDQKLLFEPGAYRLGNLQFQGIKTDHDRDGGRRFGTNVVWGWTQGGIKILHLGGAAAPISFEQQILMGRPDLLLLPVGGGPKAYNPEDALAAMKLLNPKVVIPTHYRTQAADDECDLQALDDFLQLVSDAEIRRVNSDTIDLRPADLPTTGTVIQVLSYPL